MTVHVFQHRNGGFPDTHEKCFPVLNHGNTVLEIRDAETDYIRREYNMDEVSKFTATEDIEITLEEE